MNTSLTTTSPAFDAIEKSIISDSNLQPSTKNQYLKAWMHAKISGIDITDSDAVASYFATLKKSHQAFFAAVIGRAVKVWKKAIRNGVSIEDVTPELIAKMQLGMWKLDDLHDSVETHETKGTKAHVWLSREQVEQITALPDRSTPMGKRDWIILAILLASGLRRSELASLTFDALKQQPMRNGQPRDVLEILHGKGDKARVIPISKRLADGIREWHAVVGDGRIARSVNKAGKINGSLSDKSINDIVQRYGHMIGVDIAAHATRRTFNQLSYEAGADILQLKEVDGHASVSTTQKYLNLALNLEDTPSDTIPLS